MWGKRICLALAFLTLSVVNSTCTPPDPIRAFLEDLVANRWPNGRYMGAQKVSVGETPSDEEWIVFYREQDRASDPVKCAAYWLSVEHCQPEACDEMPSFVAYDLPECECGCACEAEKEDLLSEHDGDELIIWDKCGEHEQRKKLHVYTWITGTQTYTPLAHFHANCVDGERDCIEEKKDWIQARIPIPGAAQIEFCCEYSLLQEELIYRNDSKGKCEFDFQEGIQIPDHALQSPHPEMVVLAYYKQCTNPDEAEKCFTDAGWKSVGAGEPCGCPATSEPTSHVHVIDMTITETRSVPGRLGEKCPKAYQKDCPKDRTFLTTVAECVYEESVVESKRITTTWVMQWTGNGWLAESLSPEGME